MELVEQFQNRINEAISNPKIESWKYNNHVIYNVSGNFEINKIDNIENAVKLNPDFIIAEIEYSWTNYNYENVKHHIIFLTKYSYTNSFVFKNWKIAFNKGTSTYSVEGYYFNISDQLGFEREVKTNNASLSGYKELFEYVKLVSRYNTWQEYDLFIENYHLRFDNLENRIENTWNRLLLTQDLNLLAEFKGLEKEIQNDIMFDKDELNMPTYFFAEELYELSKKADLIYRISLIKKGNCLFAAGSKVVANNCFANAIQKWWSSDGSNEEIVESLELMIQKDRELLVKYFQIDL